MNTGKGDRTADLWLPHKEYRRRFAALQIAAKTRFRLSVTAAEAAAPRDVLHA